MIEPLLPLSGAKGRPRVDDRRVINGMLYKRANRTRRGATGCRPPVFDKTAYRRRNIVERCFQRLTQFRVIATPYDKTALSYQATIDLATRHLWLEDAP